MHEREHTPPPPPYVLPLLFSCNFVFLRSSAGALSLVAPQPRVCMSYQAFLPPHHQVRRVVWHSCDERSSAVTTPVDSRLICCWCDCCGVRRLSTSPDTPRRSLWYTTTAKCAGCSRTSRGRPSGTSTCAGKEFTHTQLREREGCDVAYCNDRLDDYRQFLVEWRSKTCIGWTLRPALMWVGN